MSEREKHFVCLKLEAHSGVQTCDIRLSRQTALTRVHAQLHSDSRHEGKILNNQFCPVVITNIPKLPGPLNTEMPNFESTVLTAKRLWDRTNS